MKNETKTAEENPESIKIVQHTKHGLIDIIENKDCLEVRQLSQYGGRDIVLILPENRKSVALAICPELTQQQSANAELKKQNEESTKFIQMHLDSLDLSNLDFYNKYGFNVAETFPRTREFISKHTT